jgi:hypothetical protein
VALCARDTKTLSESIFLCESFSVHVEVAHKSENGFMNSACNRLYRETVTENMGEWKVRERERRVY